MDAPVIGADTSPYPKEGTWDVFTTMRYQKSDRHYVGPNESSFTDPKTGTVVEQVRIKEGSQVINKLYLLDIGVRYNVSKRESVSLSIPYLMAERSQPITGTRDPKTFLRPILDRYTTHATGVSDITLTYRRWMLDPDTHPKANFSLGGGIKVPTGQSAAHDTFEVLVAEKGADGKPVYSSKVAPVDQSIQPGDGGWGFLLDFGSFFRFGSGNVGAYAAASYLFNPDDTNDLVRTGTVVTKTKDGNYILSFPPTTGLNAHNSVTDQYIVRLGLSTRIVEHLAFSGGLRLEGVPSSDALGNSAGFRRPGYSLGVEPSLSWSGGNNSLSLAVPFAIKRNRTANVNDIANNNGTPGDAAFADYVIMASFGHHFD